MCGARVVSGFAGTAKSGGGRTEGRRMTDPENGQDKVTPTPAVPPVAAHEGFIGNILRTLHLDRTLAASDQTTSDADQASSDADQARSASDQILAARDQISSGRDQTAADAEHAAQEDRTPAQEDLFQRSRSERDEASADRRRHG